MLRRILSRLRRTSDSPGPDPEQQRELERAERLALEAQRQRHAAEASMAQQRAWIDSSGGWGAF